MTKWREKPHKHTVGKVQNSNISIIETDEKFYDIVPTHIHFSKLVK